MFSHHDERLAIPETRGEPCTDAPIRVDLVNPTPEKDAKVERLLGIEMPTQAEMEEIELTERLSRKPAPNS